MTSITVVCESCQHQNRVTLAVGVAAEEAKPEKDDLDALELAELIGMSRGFVYENKERLGGRPITEGERPRWRFDRQLALGRWKAIKEGTDNVTPIKKPRRRRKSDLLSVDNL
jgi:hypothetical protein